MKTKAFLLSATVFFAAFALHGQVIDILIKNGHVIDPKNNVDSVMDIAIGDKKILEVSQKITKEAKKVVDATRLYFTPGLIDIHIHHFFFTEPSHYTTKTYHAF